MDLAAANSDDIVLVPGQVVLVPTGFAIEIPPQHEAQIRPRSGLAVDHGITMPNAPGTIDSDYRGEILVPLLNFGRMAFTVVRGMRIAQLVVARVESVTWNEVSELPKSVRGSSGFGHSGV